jgi:hypothetical protein
MSVFLDRKSIKSFANEILDLLKAELKNLSGHVSPRMVGDSAQDIIEKYFATKLPAYIGVAEQEKFARRAMADVAFTDIQNNYVIVDVKTHNVGTSFNMPNLTSVERIARFYEDDSNYFSLLIAKYEIIDEKPKFSEIIFVPIEHLNWDCLTIGALGWGQIQLANANIIHINTNQTRKDWMLKLCDVLEVFYPKEISKITDRIEQFRKVREFWENK